jgi:nucleoside-triphosphatase
MNHIYLLTGKPGIGKTTTIKKVIDRISVERCGGFYTEEIRVRDTRIGFRLVTLDGRTGVFAHIKSESPLRIGRYGVNLDCLESLGIVAIQEAIETKKIIIIDEIGLMEGLSDRFKKTVLEVFKSSSSFLGTIALKPHPWLDMLKQQEGVVVYTLTPDNRDTMIDTLVPLVSSFK